MAIRKVRVVACSAYGAPSFESMQQQVVEHGHCLRRLFLRVDRFSTSEHASSYLASFSHPSTRVNTQLRILHDLYNRVDELDVMVRYLRHTFDGWSEADLLCSRAEALHRTALRKVTKAVDKLSAVAEKHQPAYFTTCVNAVKAMLHSAFKTRCSGIKSFTLVRVVEKNGETVGTQFTTYICLTGLTDDKNFTYPKFHLAVTCLVDKKGKFTMNLSAQPLLLLPGKFKAGDIISNAKHAMEVALQQLKDNGISRHTDLDAGVERPAEVTQ